MKKLKSYITLVILLTFSLYSTASYSQESCVNNVKIYNIGDVVECPRVGYSKPYDQEVRIALELRLSFRDKIKLLQDKLQIKDNKIFFNKEQIEILEVRVNVWKDDAMKQSDIIKNLLGSNLWLSIEKLLYTGLGMVIMAGAYLLAGYTQKALLP